MEHDKRNDERWRAYHRHLTNAAYEMIKMRLLWLSSVKINAVFFVHTLFIPMGSINRVANSSKSTCS